MSVVEFPRDSKSPDPNFDRPSDFLGKLTKRRSNEQRYEFRLRSMEKDKAMCKVSTEIGQSDGSFLSILSLHVLHNPEQLGHSYTQSL
jgi:hypothetical protein